MHDIIAQVCNVSQQDSSSEPSATLNMRIPVEAEKVWLRVESSVLFLVSLQQLHLSFFTGPVRATSVRLESLIRPTFSFSSPLSIHATNVQRSEFLIALPQTPCKAKVARACST